MLSIPMILTSTRPSVPLVSISKKAGAPRTTSFKPSPLAVACLISTGARGGVAAVSPSDISHLKGLPKIQMIYVSPVELWITNLPGTSSSLKVILTKWGTASCGIKVTSYRPRLRARTSALTDDLVVVTTSSRVPSPAWDASTVNVIDSPTCIPIIKTSSWLLDNKYYLGGTQSSD